MKTLLASPMRTLLASPIRALLASPVRTLPTSPVRTPPTNPVRTLEGCCSQTVAVFGGTLMSLSITKKPYSLLILHTIECLCVLRMIQCSGLVLAPEPQICVKLIKPSPIDRTDHQLLVWCHMLPCGTRRDRRVCSYNAANRLCTKPTSTSGTTSRSQRFHSSAGSPYPRLLRQDMLHCSFTLRRYRRHY